MRVDISGMSPQMAAAYWSLDHLGSDQLPQLGMDWLESGLDTYSLRILAGETDPSLAETGPLFERALHELGVAIPDQVSAGWQIALWHAGRILDEAITPHTGAASIWDEVSQFLDDDLISRFVGAASQYDDWTDADHLDWYGAERCEQTRQMIDAEIRLLAQQLVKARKNL